MERPSAPIPTPCADAAGVQLCIDDTVLLVNHPDLAPVYTVKSVTPVLDPRFPPGTVCVLLEGRAEIYAPSRGGQIPGVYLIGQRTQAPGEAPSPLITPGNPLPFPKKDH